MCSRNPVTSHITYYEKNISKGRIRNSRGCTHILMQVHIDYAEVSDLNYDTMPDPFNMKSTICTPSLFLPHSTFLFP